jgi:hypothetical protein
MNRSFLTGLVGSFVAGFFLGLPAQQPHHLCTLRSRWSRLRVFADMVHNASYSLSWE